MKYAPTISIDEELAIIRRGAEDIFPEGELEEKLKRARREGRPLRVKLGSRSDCGRPALGAHDPHPQA